MIKSLEIVLQFLLDQQWRIVMGDVMSKAACCLWLVLQGGNQVDKPVFVSRDRILGQKCHKLSVTPGDPLVAGVAMLKMLLINLMNGDVGLSLGEGLQ